MSQSGRRSAILIGSSQFDKEPLKARPLKCPERDVDGMRELLAAAELGAYGEVFVFKNSHHQAALDQIEEVLNSATREDQVLIYYSGHGETDLPGRLYLTATNTDTKKLVSTSIPVETLRTMIENSACRKIIMILDCCFGGAAGKSFVKGSVDEKLKELARGYGIYILTASTAAQTAQERESDDYGLLTKHIIVGIREGSAANDEGIINMDGLYRYVYAQVTAEGYQEPMRWALNVKGEDLIIARSSKSPARERQRLLTEKVIEVRNLLPRSIFNKAFQIIDERRAPFYELLDGLYQQRMEIGEFVEEWYRIERQQLAQTVPKAQSLTNSPNVSNRVLDRLLTPEHGTYKLPSSEVLTPPSPRREMTKADEAELLERARQLAEKCAEFNVSGQVKQISPGPVVTTFEFKPDPGVKYSRITSLVDDLCLGLKAESIRIDRIPGKSTVGIEVPNNKREIIRLREVVESKKFRESESKLTLALGKTIDGSNFSADLAKMPNLLIAGATGAGKSVALNSILISLLCKATPDEVKLILVDPKRLELGLYADLPHLLTPIVTDPKRAGYALKWAVSEMENRYKHLAQFGVRNIEQYNKEVADMKPAKEGEEAPLPLPYIVIIIDELADLMMVAAREVEESITRLAQMARAVGIHLVLATQRPSVDVITGLIKANFPSRISFRVSSKVDSRTIIDTNGAEGLLGQGDMLFLGPGTSRLVRVHGAYVDEKEVKRICDFIRKQGNPAYDEKIVMNEKEADGSDGGDFNKDEKYEDAVRIVIKSQKASTSLLQRHLRIGYGRAASIVDMMQREGIVGPEDGTKPRQVLVKPDFLERLDQMREDGEY